ncbi:MAG: PQQ-dependent sugar dehydrogenase, partial [Polyangiales bacterium]
MLAPPAPAWPDLGAKTRALLVLGGLAALALQGCDCGGGGAAPLTGRPANPTCLAGPRPLAPDVRVELEPVFAGLRFDEPVFALQAPGDSTHWYVGERAGRVHRVALLDGSATDFVDITGQVDSGPGEAGLLGMAFAPDYAQSGVVYLHYTGNQGGLESRLVRMRSPDRVSLDAGSEERLLTQPQFAGNHNGGDLRFGPDGHLYLAFGDGGGGGDPQNHGQNPQSWLGAVLRLQVTSTGPYTIPADNPFATSPGPPSGNAPEIFAWGLRNPWRMGFDRATGALWAGDVGQDEREEVNILVAGGNYGWNLKEGTLCFATPGCNSQGLIDPVFDYDRSQGDVAVVGGFVYRGAAVPGLVGQYVFGDFASGRIWALRQTPDGYVRDLLLESGRNISAFAEDTAGELYALAFDGSFSRIAPVDPGAARDPLPALLSQTGCFNPGAPTEPVDALIPYTVNAPLWSDGADKRRWFAIPDGSFITIGADGHWDLPPGSVLVKEFKRDGRLLETRLLRRHDSGEWLGSTYVWDEAETDATLLQGNLRLDRGGASWLVPSRAECLRCHTEAAGRSLGLENAALNRDFDDPRAPRGNQLKVLAEWGFFTAPLPADPAQLPAHP